jgi:hypothetical protein
MFIRRRALHQYDPSDLQNTLGDESSHGSVAGGVSKTTCTGEAGSSPVLPMTVQDREIAQVQAQGLLVDTSLMDPGAAPMVSPASLAPNRNDNDDKNQLEDVIFNGTAGTSATMEGLELEQWDVTRQKTSGENWWADEDSDDDGLL